MARTVEFITRTVKSTTITYKCANLSDDTITTETITVAKVFADADEAKKYLDKVNPYENVAILKVISLEQTEKLYGMTVDDFMKKAVELDPVTRRPIK